MEQIENKMLLDEYWNTDHTDLDKYYEHLAERDDERWEDMLND